ncbi:hypothetical protein DRN58_04175 [Thermococci archaeon]|nr:MAG: hypothetical protein DRN58_04175 [Thermococci archaeon]
MRKIEEQIEEIFSRYNDRKDIERELELLGFDKWAEWTRGDEVLYFYDKGVPNGQIIITINWIEGFYRVYEKVFVGDIG